MRRALTLIAVGALALATTYQFASARKAPHSAAAQAAWPLAPLPARAADEGEGLRTAIFAGGCFWGVEGVFSHVRGVTSAVTGYHGGQSRDATYVRVSTGESGHAEAVRVTYDPRVVRYDQLLRIFFSVVADPTTLNRQGPDSGAQYRSALVPLSEEQRLVASAYLAQMQASGVWRAPIVTRLEPYRKFHAAEPEHQDFMAKNPRHPYILRWDAAKLTALKRGFPKAWKPAFTTG